MVRSEPQHLLEVLESLLHVVLVVETEAADINGVGARTVHAQNVAANSASHTIPASQFTYTVRPHKKQRIFSINLYRTDR